MRVPRGSSWLLVGVHVLTASTAGAQTAAQAEQLFREGKRLVAAGKLREGCEAFRASHKLDASTSTLMNLADCEEKSGHFATAWEAYVAVERQTRDQPRLAKLNRIAATRAQALEPRLSSLTIEVGAGAEIAGLRVMLDGTQVEAGAWNRGLPIDGGDHHLVARAPDHDEWSTTVSVAPAGDRKTVTVPVLKRTDDGAARGSRAEGSTVFGGGGGFVTSGVVGFELGVSYSLNPRWDVHGSYLYGRSSVSNVEGTFPMTLHVVRVRVTRLFPRRSRVEPFVGVSLLIDRASVRDGALTTPGFTVEPGLYFALTNSVRLFVEVPVGAIASTQIRWITPMGGTATNDLSTFFGGVGAGLQVGGTL